MICSCSCLRSRGVDGSRDLARGQAAVRPTTSSHYRLDAVARDLGVETLVAGGPGRFTPPGTTTSARSSGVALGTGTSGLGPIKAFGADEIAYSRGTNISRSPIRPRPAWSACRGWVGTHREDLRGPLHRAGIRDLCRHRVRLLGHVATLYPRDSGTLFPGDCRDKALDRRAPIRIIGEGRERLILTSKISPRSCASRGGCPQTSGDSDSWAICAVAIAWNAGDISGDLVHSAQKVRAHSFTKARSAPLRPGRVMGVLAT